VVAYVRPLGPSLSSCMCCLFVGAVVMHRLMDAINNKIQNTKEEREARRQFTIEKAGDVPTMRTEASPAKQQPAGEE